MSKRQAQATPEPSLRTTARHGPCFYGTRRSADGRCRRTAREGRAGQRAVPRPGCRGQPRGDRPTRPCRGHAPGRRVRGACPPRGRSRPRQDPGRPQFRRDGAGQVHAHPVHPRPATRRPHRHGGLRPGRPPVRPPPRPRRDQRPARRRDQPRAGEGAVGPPRSDGRAAGHDRRTHLPPAAAVSRPRHREPDRAGRNLPASRGAGGPLSLQGARRLSRARRRARGR